MQTTESGLPVTSIEVRVTDPPLELFISEEAFHPNPTTVRFSRAVKVREGDVVFDIGTGVGPLAIMAAKLGASHVYAVDPVPLHCELARMNVEKYGLSDRITVLHGAFFEPIDRCDALADKHADVIIGDVSGIADGVARALGWYSEVVPTGGEDGTDVIIDLLQRAKDYLAPGGSLVFPVALDLSDGDKIFEAARTIYPRVENALERPNVTFPVTDEEMAAIEAVYDGNVPSFITIQTGRRTHWRGQIWRATA